jgi:hypothetical protein
MACWDGAVSPVALAMGSAPRTATRDVADYGAWIRTIRPTDGMSSTITKRM